MSLPRGAPCPPELKQTKHWWGHVAAWGRSQEYWHCFNSCSSAHFITCLCVWGTNPQICQVVLVDSFRIWAIRLPNVPLCRVSKNLVFCSPGRITELLNALSTGDLIRAWKSYWETEIMTMLLLSQFNFKIKISKETFEETYKQG